MRLFAALALCFLASSALAETKIQEITSGNLTAWLSEDHALPIVTVRMAFDEAGSAYDPWSQEGLALLASQMLDEGAGGMDSLAYHHALDDSAIRFEASADEDMFIVSLRTLSEYRQRAFDLLGLALLKPRFDDDALARVRAADLAELKELETNPDYLASLRWKQLAFGPHPYGRPRRGTLTSLARINRQDLAHFAEERIGCGQPIISVVGDITAQEVKHWLEGLKLHPAACTPVKDNLADITVKDGGSSPIVVPLDVAQTVVTASLPGVKRDSPDYYALEVLSHILGGNSLTARLGREIRDRRGLAYYAQSGVSVSDHTGYIALDFATRNAEAYAALNVFEDTIRTLSEQGVTAEELADAKSYLTGSFPLDLDSQEALAGDLVAMQHYHLGRDYIGRRNAQINAVTLAQVNAAAKTFLSHKPLVVMAGRPEAQKEKKP